MSSSLPSTQKAWVLPAQNKPLELKSDWPVPSAAAGRLVVKTHAISLNPVDWKIQSYGSFFGMPLPNPLGWDYSGTVVAVGEGVNEFKVGDEVFGLMPMWEAGVYAEYISAAANTAVKKPSSISHEDASCFGIAGLSSYSNLLRQQQLGHSLTNKTVFVAGGSGGVGHMQLFFARALGASKVFTSATREDAMEWIKKEAKVDEIINYKKENVLETIKKLTKNEGVDVAYDSTYQPSSVLQSAEMLKEGGVLNVLSTDENPPEDVQKVLSAKKASAIYWDMARFGLKMKDRVGEFQQQLKDISKLYEEGKFKVYVTEVGTFDKLPEALEKLKTGNFKGGKIVVKVV